MSPYISSGTRPRRSSVIALLIAAGVLYLAKEVLIPGEPEARTASERRAAGIAIDDETWRQIQQCFPGADVKD